MERYKKIPQHKEFQKYLREIEELEQDRIYCRHGLNHLLDVARISYIKALEEKVDLSRDVIYGVALLHDIGKVKQYKEGIPHELAGAKKAGKILFDCGYYKDEIKRMEEAILCHRRGNNPKDDRLAGILYEADKISRMCMFCPARTKCNWTEEEQNKTVCY